MIIATQIGHFVTDRIEDEHLSGSIEIINEPPKDLECPNSKVNLRYDVVLIDSDSNNPRHWRGCTIHWDNAEWIITFWSWSCEKLPRRNIMLSIVRVES